LDSSSIASLRLFISSGSTRIAASPVTSGIELISLAIVGQPQANASRTGNPNPSYSDGNTKVSA